MPITESARSSSAARSLVGMPGGTRRVKSRGSTSTPSGLPTTLGVRQRISSGQVLTPNDDTVVRVGRLALNRPVVFLQGAGALACRPAVLDSQLFPVHLAAASCTRGWVTRPWVPQHRETAAESS